MRIDLGRSFRQELNRPGLRLDDRLEFTNDLIFTDSLEFNRELVGNVPFENGSTSQLARPLAYFLDDSKVL